MTKDTPYRSGSFGIDRKKMEEEMADNDRKVWKHRAGIVIREFGEVMILSVIEVAFSVTGAVWAARAKPCMPWPWGAVLGGLAGAIVCLSSVVLWAMFSDKMNKVVKEWNP